MNARHVAPTLSASIAQTKGYVYTLPPPKDVQNQALSRLCVWSKPYEPHRRMPFSTALLLASL